MAKQSTDMASRLTNIEKRLTALENESMKHVRKVRDYSDEQRAAVRARFRCLDMTRTSKSDR